MTPASRRSRPTPAAGLRARPARAIALALAALLAGGASALAAGREGPFRFVDAAGQYGLTGPLKGIMSHAAACGDLDGDGDLDLYVGMFCDRPAARYVGRSGPVPNVLLVQEAGRFRDAAQPDVAFQARTSGAVFADLDNDGDLDLYVSNNSKRAGLRAANRLFENVGGRFRDRSDGSAACPVMGGRSVGVLDFDGDGLLDLLVAEDQWTGGRTRLFRNRGRLAFEDVTAAAGLPESLPGLGVVTADLNEDGRPDLFIAQANRLLLSGPDGTYREDARASAAFQYEPVNREGTPCGAACGDLDRDGDLDLVVVDHSQPARMHLFVNLGLRAGRPQFRDVTRQAGLEYRFPSWTPGKLHLKHAHVAVGDFDNDGWADILVAATYRSRDGRQPFICRNVTASAGRLRFVVPPVEKADAYFPAGPVADFDRDGRLDVLLASWFPQIPSSLFLNRGQGGHWLRVRVVGRNVNRMGIGAQVKLYAAGRLGRADALLGFQEVGLSDGFCTGGEAVAHFGLGRAAACDVEVVLPHARGRIRKKRVPADRVLVVAEPAATPARKGTPTP